MRRIKAHKEKFELKDEIELIYEKEVTRFGTGAKIDCPKKFIGRKAYVLIKKED